MDEIRGIEIRSLDINKIPDIWSIPSQAIPPVVSVTQQIGTPIVDIPGCVEARQDPSKSKVLSSDDPNGTLTFCDGNLPSFKPIEYSPNNIRYTGPAKVPPYKKEEPKKPESPQLPPPAPPATAKIECPTPAQSTKEPVGTYLEGFRKKVVGYELLGNECVQITEKVPVKEQLVAGLPTGGQVVATGSIAIVATASALMAKPLADVLLKVIKPTVKKVMKKIAAIRGKTEPVLSVSERRDLQRERTQALRALKSALKPKG